MAHLEAEARAKRIEKLQAQRAELRKRIDTLVAERRAFLEKDLEKGPKKGPKGWEQAIRECVQAQTERFGIRFGE